MRLSRKMALLPAMAMSAAAMVGMSESAIAEWSPKKPVEFVIMAGPGGGADQMGRLIQTIIEQEDLSTRPFIPVNKAGGAGAEALMHMKSKQGDNHTLMVTLNSFYTTPLRQPGLRVKPDDFTPIARMAEDTFLLWVHKDKGINTVDEFVKAAKAKGSDWVMAGTGRGGADELLTHFLNATYDLDMKYVPFSGGGRVAKELAGKQADSTVNNPSEQKGFYNAGKTVPLAQFNGERSPNFQDVPTFIELGENFEYYMQRSIVAPPGMDKEAQAYYIDLMQKVYETDQWKKYMKTESLLSDILVGDDLAEYWNKNYGYHEVLLEKIGEL